MGVADASLGPIVDLDLENTDTSVDARWAAGPWRRQRQRLHLSIAWYGDDPSRVGQVAAIDGPCWLGRSPEQAGAIGFYELRPGKRRPVGSLASRAISRRQLELEPIANDTLAVRCVGKRQLLHNGQPVQACQARVGDTLMLEHSAVLLVDSRPLELPPLEYYPNCDAPFGAEDPHGMVGESPSTWSLREQLALAARARGHVLLLGESGVGKELAATTLHALSDRASGNLISRNAATIPDSLIDAELFGNVRNYPNAGSPHRDGMIAAANGGWLVLDEIAELPEALQARLLRVLDSQGEYHCLGDPGRRVSNFRLIAITNRDPSELKHDVLARLTHRIQVPGLQARRSDIPLLINALLVRDLEQGGLAERYLDSATGDMRVDPVLVDELLRHDFTHHTRELQTLLNAAMTSSPEHFLTLTPAVAALLSAPKYRPARADEHQPSSADDQERNRLSRALTAHGGNVTRAAEALGVSRHTVHRMIRKHGLNAKR